MRVLVLGAGGQLGRDLVPTLGAAGHYVIAADRRAVDVTSQKAVSAAVGQGGLDRVVNCAAYTKVDQAELEPELAYAINRDAAAVVAQACADRSVPLCHVSTDFVFTQASPSPTRPWSPVDEPSPKGVYATSKREGELACMAAGAKLFLARTSWLYGNRGPNFPLSILRAAASGQRLQVVSDQFGSPTWTAALSVALCWLLATDDYGVYHLSGTGETSWFDFALAVLEEAGQTAEVKRVTAAEWGALSPRPSYSVLDNSDYLQLGGPALPPWRESLRRYIAEERQGAVRAAVGGG